MSAKVGSPSNVYALPFYFLKPPLSTLTPQEQQEQQRMLFDFHGKLVGQRGSAAAAANIVEGQQHYEVNEWFCCWIFVRVPCSI